MKVTYVDHMGTDLSVVNAARVSFDKESSGESWNSVYCPSINRHLAMPVLGPADVKLVNYLATHGHWSPFAHAVVTMRWKAPIFVARQLAKHQVGMSWNEVSRRYVDTTPELYWPEKWRKAAENVKQGSSDEEFDDLNEHILDVERYQAYVLDDYTYVIKEGLCPEQARMFLPLNTYTEWIWTGSLYAWARVYNQRTESSAQQETRQLCLTIGDICGTLFPVSWKALTTKSV